MKLTVIYDNYQYAAGWETGWGFSCLAENDSGERLLFDTGDNQGKLLRNLSLSGTAHDKITALTFSHSDWDHVDGAWELLGLPGNMHVYTPGCFGREFIGKVESSGKQQTVIGAEKKEIIKGIYVTPVFARPFKRKEQSLVIKSAEGLVLVTGCAHPGILYIAGKVKKMFSENIYMALGGFHLMDYGVPAVSRLADSLRSEGIRKFAPSHCTGKEQIEVFEDRFGDDYIKMGSGRTIEL
ncbi:MAG: MBL fold metallo-hydrolase [Elusimicrobia bacterium]|nr:MBL fold metallo-hydrolase [Elusimicrobiota bacterium]